MSPAKKQANPIDTPPASEEGKAQKEKKQKQPKGKKHKEQPVNLPILVEVCFSFAGIFLILVDMIVAWISFVSGASWPDIFLRVVVSTVTVGFVLWLFTMNLSNGTLTAALKHLEEEEENAKMAEQSAEDAAIHSSFDKAVEA